ncbi:MAG: DEAD/DEAH box helicase [Clostridia bacterium]|nr:DEAD/DEAH box helicase [Clostridia bacterium]
MAETDALNSDLRRRLDGPRHGEELAALVEGSLPGESNLRLELTLVPPRESDPCLRFGLRVWDRRWYVVRDLPAFLRAWRKGEPYSFQSRFVFEPSWMRFREEDLAVLSFLSKLIAVHESVSWAPTQAEARLMRLPDALAEDLLSLLKNQSFRVLPENGEPLSFSGIPEASLPLRVECRMTPRGLELVAHLPPDLTPITRDCAYLLSGDSILQVPPEQRELLRFLLPRQEDLSVAMTYPLSATEQVVGEILPWLKLRTAVEMSEELRRMLVRLPLESRVYLDRDGNSVVARVAFRYGETELNPFAPAREKIALARGEKLLLRDAEREHAVLEILASAGFRVTRENIRLSQPDALFAFMTEGVHRLDGVSDVFLSKDFKRMVVRRPGLRGGLRMEEGSLLLSLSLDQVPTDEVLGILEALSRSRSYYRLKDGSFLNLEGLEDWRKPAETLMDAARRDGLRVERDALVLRGYRAGYLRRLLAESSLPLEADESVVAVEEELSGTRQAVPAPAVGIPLRDYQQRGYQWLYTLDRLHMGGILADDMGLGKTVQIIALLRATRAPDRCSLVVAPTSLTYNWLSELHRFAPDLSAAVISGSAAQRERMWQHIREAGDVDVAITSYPLIRRDIDWMAGIPFRFAILDEAQNIKNAGSQVASAARRLQADTRLALTGTPMENGIGELWSIFDFVLPGYLPSYPTFIRRYQDGMNSEDLRMRIRPFLTRRLKQEVLSELPDKAETRLSASMTPEQMNVYKAAMERLRPKIQSLAERQELGRSRMEVLSAITELRQICCHPALVLDGYQGGSGKQEMLMEILPSMIRSGRRVLIFSQFTSLLKLLEPALQREGYQTLYLDGGTPADERLELTERFNAGEGQIFLISLRAGGSGLNLTGADVVIHFDPWWNPAAEDQATDRAHRIGQTKKVDVIRLVMGESIEEKVVELGERKKALFDRLITPGESGLSALTEQDIRDLFD